MDGLKELSTRPLKTFDEAHMNGQANYLRRLAADVSRLSWDMDEVLRNVRRAETAEQEAEALTVARATAQRVAREALTLGFNI